MDRSDFQRVNVVVVLLERAIASRGSVDATLVVDALQLREILTESLRLVDGLLAESSEGGRGAGYDPRRVDLDAKAESLRVAIGRIERVLTGLSDHPELREVFASPRTTSVSG